ncbi:MAG: hypothetical protein OEV23_05310 [Gallionella sp.]|nr:hypothetical protein [Gallionella sp.]
MPITPFHFGPGAVLHAAAPRHISFLSFCAANILIDIEPLYFMFTQQYPLHRSFHTYVGATLVVGLTCAFFVFARKLAAFDPLPYWLQWLQLRPAQVAFGAATGSYSHIVLDSVMHGDITPLAPFSDANILLGIVSLDVLHWSCAVAGLLAVIWIGVRRNFRE